MTTRTTETMTAPATLSELFDRTVAARAGRPALRAADGSTAITWGEYAAQVDAVAGGLAGLGLGRGDTLAFWLGNRPELHVADAGALRIGAVPLSVYPTFRTAQIERVIADAAGRVLITESAFLEAALALRDGGRTALETVVVVDGSDDARALTWDELPACAAAGFDPDGAARAVQPDDVAAITYTAGTTGPPKAIRLTHRNVLSAVAALRERLRLPTGVRAVSWLPMAHIAARLFSHYLPMDRGWAVTTCPDPRSVAELLRSVRPGVFFAPPFVWQALRAGVLAALSPADRAALAPAAAGARAGEGPVGSEPAATIRARLGFAELEVAVIGGAVCPADLIEFWHAVGIPLAEVYGLSETTGVATANPPQGIRIGTAGTALPGVELRLSDNGEVLVRGPGVITGSGPAHAATDEAVDADGWLHTGDIGVVDRDGYLRVVDRLEDLIVSAAGERMSPARIEATIKAVGGPVGHACALGHGRPYNTALVTLDPVAAGDLAARRRIADASYAALVTSDAVLAEIAAQIERANQRLEEVERIRDFMLLAEDWAPGGDELTAAMTLRRSAIAEKYAAEIARLYGG